MIPVRLAVRNFLCYGEGLEPLDLEGIHVACLCGENGHGKSALLDAMTWALWGQARASRQEDLIHQGQAEMQVDLEFLVGGDRYRVVRKHARGRGARPGSTDLQLLIAAGDGYRPITENSIRQTEERIQRLLRMDYETFINTSFLLQGQADKFTTSKPADRKRLLAEVLGLGRYEEAAQRARDRAGEMKDQERQIEGELQALAQLLLRRPDLQRELEEAQGELLTLGPLLEASQSRRDALQEAVEESHRQREGLTRVQEALGKALAEQSALEQQAAHLEARLARLTAVVARREEVQGQYARWLRLQQSEEGLEQSRQQAEALLGRKHALEMALAQERERLQAQASAWRQRLQEELTPRANQIPALEKELQAIQSQETELQTAEAQLQRERQALETTVARAQEVATLQQVLRQEMEQLKARSSLLSQAGARCPVCQTPLGPDNRQHLEEELRAQEQRSHQASLAHQRDLKALESQRQALRHQVEQQERALAASRRQHQATLTRLEADLAQARKAAEERVALRQDLLSLEERLARQEDAPQVRGELRQVAGQLEVLAYDPARHLALRQELRALAEYPLLHQQLQEAERFIAEEAQALALARQMAFTRAREVAELQAIQKALQDAVANLPPQEAALATAQKAWQELAARQRSVEDKIRQCQWELERLALVERKRAQRNQELLALRQERGVYEELAQAFGKNGLQAYLIDEALPELEQEANALLARLTSNRMHLKLETQRQRRTTPGEPIETLDIAIGDELGTRSYELFSGGEAFRVNVALRIALSKLLARRAGAPLPTLFIDEGFGTQDTAGRERLVEVINAIQEDFQRIIVITHLEEIKDLFPVRIEVLKTEAGSRYWIS